MSNQALASAYVSKSPQFFVFPGLGGAPEVVVVGVAVVVGATVVVVVAVVIGATVVVATVVVGATAIVVATEVVTTSTVVSGLPLQAEATSSTVATTACFPTIRVCHPP